MKSVLISIKPKWCELIASGEKTVEVRKTRPKLETPFKVYIYETQGRTDTPFVDEEGHHIYKGRGQVIGEFVCDNITDYTLDPYGHHSYFISDDDFEESGLTFYEELWEYGKGKTLYGWHITDLVIYDKPRELSEFERACPDNVRSCAMCRHSGFTPMKCLPLTRPPQSWCYVERSKK